MRLRAGDRLRCSNLECGLQVIVLETGCARETENLLRCSCGSPMKKTYLKPAMNKLKTALEKSATAGARGSRQ
jgi:hypothetical protein